MKVIDPLEEELARLRRENEESSRLRAELAERKRADGKLRESEEQLRDFFDNATDLIQSVAPDGRFLHVNRAWREKLGYSGDEATSLTVFDVIAPENRPHCAELFARLLAGEDIGPVETVFQAKDGTKIVVEGHVNCRFENGQAVATRSIFRDVTERKKLEEHLHKVRKLESLGILAGGIARDFNNLLTAVLGNVSLGRTLAEPGSVLAGRLAEAEAASLRAKDLTRQLLIFSRGGAPVREPADVREIAQDAASCATRGSKVRCEFDFAGDCLPVTVDRDQIGQAIANIAINAVQATPDGGVVTLRAVNVSPEEKRIPGLRGGRFVRVAVEDHGVGIPKEHMPLIFDPFFSTKSKGSGLGLATAFSIIDSHGGLITVESERGVGTTVHVYLPAEESPAERRDAGNSRTGTGRILVMDDEAVIRDVAIHMLASIGYRAQGAPDGTEALSAWWKARESGEPFDAVIMDLTIPGGMGGKEAIRLLLKADPDARAIVSSGYSDDPVMSRYAEHGFRAVIAKPYTVTELRKVLRSVLSS